MSIYDVFNMSSDLPRHLIDGLFQFMNSSQYVTTRTSLVNMDIVIVEICF